MITLTLDPLLSPNKLKNFKKMGLDFQNLHDKASYCAKLLKNGKVIGWFQGRMEFAQERLVIDLFYPLHILIIKKTI